MNDSLTYEIFNLALSNCTEPAIDEFPPDIFTQEQRRGGAIVFHFFISIYAFYTIAVICERYFVPAIVSICKLLNLPSDVAGATLMAIATSLPELFTNVIGTFLTRGDLGVGTIVGSAVFNILAICAFCGLAANEPLQLDWWSLTRDCFFYFVSGIFLLLVLIDRKVFWYEALVFIIFYFLYILVMYKNKICKEWTEKCVHFIAKTNSMTSDAQSPNPSKQHLIPYDDSIRQDVEQHGSENRSIMGDGSMIDDFENSEILSCYSGLHSDSQIPTNSNCTSEDEGVILSPGVIDESPLRTEAEETETQTESEKQETQLLELPQEQRWFKWVDWVFGMPARLLLICTIPNCRNKRFQNWYLLTFFMSIIWIGILTYLMSWMITVIGYTLSAPDSVMGLTFIAAASSAPEAISSIIVARQGLGSMSISNSIGSNTFDILICLGVPWIIQGSIVSNSSPDYIKIISGGLVYSAILLLVYLIILYVLLAWKGFVLDRSIGLISLVMYLSFIILASLLELNVFFQANLPVCRSF